uniref:Uncharacterized protein n=1 Tax=Caenorhabditis japonica TaxID=281687 RepID=A0A8R1DHT3_CAEJA
METDLSVLGKPGYSENNNHIQHHVKVKSGTRHSTDSPIELEKAEEINRATTTTNEPLLISTSTTTTTPPITTTSSEAPSTTTAQKEMTTTSSKVTEVKQNFHATPMINEEIEKSVENLEKAIQETINSEGAESNSLNETAIEQIDRELEMRLEETAKQLQHTLTNLVSNSSDVRQHEKTKKCLTSEGVVCEFGCEDRKTCICPTATHARLISGVCADRETMLHTICLPRREINATWDSMSGNIMVRRSDALYHIESAELVDKLFVEFGKVDLVEGRNEENETEIQFNDSHRSKIVVLIQAVLKSSVFSSEPFIFHVNQSINMNSTYGMRFCVFNSSQIRNPHNYNWDDVSRFEKNEQIAEVIQLSPVTFTNKLSLVPPTIDSYWNTLITIAKIAILVILALAIFILVYLNCTKFRTMYDRKRTHYFRPFYIDPAEMFGY